MNIVIKGLNEEKAKRQKALDAAKAAYAKTVAEKDAAVARAKTDLEAAAKDLSSFKDDVLKSLNQDAPTAPRGKPGPKPATASASAPKGKPGPKPGPKKAKPGPKPAKVKASAKGPKAKPGPKPKKASKVTAKASAKASAKGPKGKPGPKPAASKRAAQGREAVKAGLRPPIKDAMAQVMGDEVLNADTIFERLEKKGWLPNAKKPRAYIGYLLSATKERFESVPSKGRGFYRRKDKTSKVNGGGKKTEETKAAPPAPKSEAKVESKVDVSTKSTPTADEVLKDLGMGTDEAAASFGG